MARALRVAKALQGLLLLETHIWVIGSVPALHGLRDFHVCKIKNDRDFISRMGDSTCPALVVLDLHPLHIPVGLESVLIRFRKEGAKIVAIDGLICLGSLLDLIFIPSFTVREVSWSIMGNVKIVSGWDCYLLGPPQKIRTWTPGNNVLALTGGSDATSLGKTWPCILDKEIPTECTIHWVVGPFAEEPIIPPRGKIRFVIHRAPASLQPLMETIHYAVTVLGVGFFELLRQGIPTVVFSPYGRKDEPVLERLRKENLALVAQNEFDAAKQVVELMTDTDQASRFSSKAKSRLSQDGAVRLATEVQRLLSNNKSQECGGSLAS